MEQLKKNINREWISRTNWVPAQNSIPQGSHATLDPKRADEKSTKWNLLTANELTDFLTIKYATTGAICTVKRVERYFQISEAST